MKKVYIHKYNGTSWEGIKPITDLQNIYFNDAPDDPEGIGSSIIERITNKEGTVIKTQIQKNYLPDASITDKGILTLKTSVSVDESGAVTGNAVKTYVDEQIKNFSSIHREIYTVESQKEIGWIKGTNSFRDFMSYNTSTKVEAKNLHVGDILLVLDSTPYIDPTDLHKIEHKGDYFIIDVQTASVEELTGVAETWSYQDVIDLNGYVRKTDIATGDSLGLVKSSDDVTIDSSTGIITVNKAETAKGLYNTVDSTTTSASTLINNMNEAVLNASAANTNSKEAKKIAGKAWQEVDKKQTWIKVVNNVDEIATPSEGDICFVIQA